KYEVRSTKYEVRTADRGLRTADLFRFELQRRAVDAVALPGRRRAIGEHVPEMAATLRAVDLGPRHPVAAIHGGADRSRMRRHETGPSGAGLKLRLVREQFLSATRAGKRARPLLGEQRA